MKNKLKNSRYTMPGIFLALITSVVSMAMPVSAGVRPQLVVGVVIDGLDKQYLDMLREQFGNDGFNRLMRDGVVIPHADYGSTVDATAATAMIATGASPSTTGISGVNIYDREARRLVQALNDPQAIGNFTTQTFSPRSLAVSTLADEIRIAGGGVSRVIAIAPEPTQAVILAGHTGNSALWIDDKTGYWATSTYYKDLPTSVTYRNRLKPLPSRLDTMQWTPLKPAEAYVGLPDHITHYPFRYTFPRGNVDRYAMFINSPKVNTEVTDIAGDIVDELKLGRPADGVDMLNVTYTLQPYTYSNTSENRYELIDSYLRLDRELARLFAKVESVAGPGNTVFFVAATPPSGRSRRDDERWNIPYGEFSTKKAKSLLNMYLMAKFGNGEWVNGFYNNQFFLNNKLIDERHLDAANVRLEAAAFLERMSGVDRVFTIEEILSGRGDAYYEALQRNNHANSSGDLFVEVAPGWETVDDILVPASEKRVHYVKRLAPATAPLFIMAPDVDARTIDTPVDIRVVAPTITRLLRIRSPNAASFAGLEL